MNELEPQTFAYEAQTGSGLPLTGTIDAPDADDAQRQLEALNLRVFTLAPVEGKPVKPRALSADDFMVFNQQLAQLTAAGLPVEGGLRLIAQDVRSPRLRRTIDDVASEMEAGASLAEAFDRHRQRFPAMYADLVDAGVQSGHLPGVLLNLGRHIELIHRLQATMWRVLAYPVVILIAMLLVLALVGGWMLPQFGEIFEDFDSDLPSLTKVVLSLGAWMPVAVGVVLILVAVAPLLVSAARTSRTGRAITELFALSLPFIGHVVQRNLVARWCDALRLGVEAGLDLPRALGLAGDAVASPALQSDSKALTERIERGQPASDPGRLSIIPGTVPAVIDLSSRTGDLAGTLASLSDMYQQEAEWRMAGLNAIIAPMLLLFLGSTVGIIVIALLLPLVKLITELT